MNLNRESAEALRRMGLIDYETQLKWF